MSKPRIIAFSGSTRSGSFNQTLVDLSAGLAEDAGAEVSPVSLADFELPLYGQDWEAEHGLPEKAVELKQLFGEHSGLLIACPEYNSSLTPLLKNTIDWLSRPATEDEPPLSAFTGKTACLLAASPGGFGGLRGLRHVREILSNVGVLVCPTQFALAQAHSAFNESGKLTDERQAAMLKSCIDQFVSTATRQNG